MVSAFGLILLFSSLHGVRADCSGDGVCAAKSADGNDVASDALLQLRISTNASCPTSTAEKSALDTAEATLKSAQAAVEAAKAKFDAAEKLVTECAACTGSKYWESNSCIAKAKCTSMTCARMMILKDGSDSNYCATKSCQETDSAVCCEKDPEYSTRWFLTIWTKNSYYAGTKDTVEIEMKEGGLSSEKIKLDIELVAGKEETAQIDLPEKMRPDNFCITKTGSDWWHPEKMKLYNNFGFKFEATGWEEFEDGTTEQCTA